MGNLFSKAFSVSALLALLLISGLGAEAQVVITQFPSFPNSDVTNPYGAYPPGGVTLDSSGNLYGTTEFGGSGYNGSDGSDNGVVWKIPALPVFHPIQPPHSTSPPPPHGSAPTP